MNQVDRRKVAWVAGILASGLVSSSCAVFRPIAFWRDTLIVGQVKLVDDKGQAVRDAKAEGVTLNFINLGGKIEESVVSAQSDALGKYRSPKLLPGRYKVEAMLPRYVVEARDVEVKAHEFKRNDVVLRRIREAKGKAVQESEEENIPNPGEVKIGPPHRPSL